MKGRNSFWHKVVIVLEFSFFMGLLALAQPSPAVYYFDGNEVVFQFNASIYREALKNGKQEKLEFSDLRIHEVVISGNFNNWSQKGWKLKKVGPDQFQLRKKVTDFKDPYNLDFKFLVNDEVWVGANGTLDLNIFSDSVYEDVFNIPLYDIRPVENGNSTFFLKGFPEANEVILAGSFNGWNEHQLKMVRVEGGWELSLNLFPGKYEYKFIVDKKWMHDPENTSKIRNEYGTFNSIWIVTVAVDFELQGFQNASKVILTGSFNGWKENDVRMQKNDKGWFITLNLSGGKHYYKFIVDGNWMVDPKNPMTEYDNHGNMNSVLFIQ